MTEAVVLQLERFLITISNNNYSSLGRFYAADVEYIHTLIGISVRGRKNAVEAGGQNSALALLRRTSNVRVFPNGTGQFVLRVRVEYVVRRATGELVVVPTNAKLTWKFVRGAMNPVISRLEVMPI